MKQNKAIRILALACALVLTLGLFAGCKPKVEEPVKVTPTKAVVKATPTSAPVDKLAEFKAKGFIQENGRPFNKDIQKNEDWKIKVTTPDDKNEVFAWMLSEVELLVKAVKPTDAQKAGNFNINFVVDATMQEYLFAYKGETVGSDFTLTLRGKTPTETTHAFYTALEDMGYIFEEVGPIIPTELKFNAVPTKEKVISPAVLRRGIRQHINFAMDISAYPLEEAREYIRNLARLRNNYMTFHSYPGHWTREKFSNASAFGVYINWMQKKYSPLQQEIYSGAFFYGDHYAIPNYPIVKDNIRFNTQYFCFPEVEPYYYTQPERGQIGALWLGEVMKECKRVGMELQFSTEIRSADLVYDQGLVDRIMEDYPLIDVLEFISRETGDEIKEDPTEHLAKVKPMFIDIMNNENGRETDTKYANTPAAELDNPVKDLAVAIRLVNHLQKTGWVEKTGVKLAAGCYVVNPVQLNLCSKLAEEFLPKDVWYTIMPGHSAGLVADNFVKAEISPELLKRTIIYSWIEFDGFMFLNQFSGSGLYNVINSVQDAIKAPVPALMTNHWRNAENFMSFNYFGDVVMNKDLTPEKWLMDYATKLGIKDKQEFVDSMMVIDGLSDSRRFPGNIAFAIKDTWAVRPGDGSIGSVWWWGANEMDMGAEAFRGTADSFRKIATQVKHPQSQRLINLLANCSEEARCHLEAVRLMKDCVIRFDTTTYKMPTDLTAEEKAIILESTNLAQVKLEEYFTWLTKDMIDRGVEGTLINYYYDAFLMCNNIRAVYCGVGDYIDADSDGTVVPQPVQEQKVPVKQ